MVKEQVGKIMNEVRDLQDTLETIRQTENSIKGKLNLADKLCVCALILLHCTSINSPLFSTLSNFNLKSPVNLLIVNPLPVVSPINGVNTICLNTNQSYLNSTLLSGNNSVGQWSSLNPTIISINQIGKAMLHRLPKLLNQLSNRQI